MSFWVFTSDRFLICLSKNRFSSPWSFRLWFCYALMQFSFCLFIYLLKESWRNSQESEWTRRSITLSNQNYPWWALEVQKKNLFEHLEWKDSFKAVEWLVVYFLDWTASVVFLLFPSFSCRGFVVNAIEYVITWL